MLKSIKRNLLILTIFSVVYPLALAQQVNTLYFVDNAPFRHTLNPAFQPIQDVYVGLPVIGFTQMSVGNNSVALKDVIYQYNGQTVSFLHPDGGNVDRFYHTLHSTGLISTSFETNLLSFGFRHKAAFWTFTLSEKFLSLIAIPKDAFNLALYGTPLLFDNRFNLTRLETDESLYTEAALGYAKVLNKKWSVGAKLKYLFGSANFSNTNTMIKMNAGIDQWTLIGEGNAYYSSPVAVSIARDFKSMTYSLPANTNDWLKRSGAGTGIDLGVTYASTPSLTFSAALLDLGFIRWKKNALKVNYKTDYTFDGIKGIDLSSSNLNISGNSLPDSIVAALDSASTYGSTNTSYTTFTPAILNVGAEYSFLDKKMSIGLLSRSQFFKNIISEEITLSVNARPSERINASLSTSFLEGRLGSIGAGMGLRTGFIHWTLAADYIPFQLSAYKGIPIPYNTKTFNLALGVNFVFDHTVRTAGLHKKVANKTCNCL
jgi:hypothetical protein